MQLTSTRILQTAKGADLDFLVAPRGSKIPIDRAALRPNGHQLQKAGRKFCLFLATGISSGTFSPRRRYGGREGTMPVVQKLIVLTAFNKDEHGTLIPAFEPRQMKREETAVYIAQTLVKDYDGVVVWCSEKSHAIGEHGPSVILFRSGLVPEFE
ncbi:hypothetical protein [Rhizobium mongolense]|uniref:Uncharacterized protein n=1 Tax=Rhizobium mongolense TaxID=57676 RepID=A0A7W6WCB3_9HYPH|nr:hypothetical protein [Rhizobium mongolense]MBB4272359.1 hypothetical protein [Rhizobium mongolense]